MADGYLQLRTVLDDLLQLSYLCVAILQFDAEDDTAGLQPLHEHHHLLVEEMLLQTSGRDLDTSEATFYETDGLFQESRFTGVRHTETEKAVGIAALHRLQIIVLQAINKLLGDDGCRYTRIVHIGEKAFGSILPIRHKRWEHLHLLSEEHRTTAVGLHLIDGLTVDYGMLILPQVGMCVNNLQNFNFLILQFFNSSILQFFTYSPMIPAAGHR